MIKHEAVPPSPNSSRRQRRRNERVELDVDERWALLSHGPGARRGGERKQCTEQSSASICTTILCITGSHSSDSKMTRPPIRATTQVAGCSKSPVALIIN